MSGERMVPMDDNARRWCESIVLHAEKGDLDLRHEEIVTLAALVAAFDAASPAAADAPTSESVDKPDVPPRGSDVDDWCVVHHRPRLLNRLHWCGATDAYGCRFEQQQAAAERGEPDG